MLFSFDELPQRLKNEKVKEYYYKLNGKKVQLLLKRTFDIAGSAAAIAVLSPLIGSIAAAVKLCDGGKVFFRQERVTAGGKIFRIHKFRTMVTGAEKGSSVTVRGDSRITPVGQFLRKHKLDELGQLFDVFQGNMSFVGTRPEVPKYVENYTDEMKATLLMPAGLTSTASVLYADENKLLSAADDVDKVYIEQILPDKMQYNLADIENFSIFNDLKILFQTAKVVISDERPKKQDKKLVAVLTNNDDDIYCFRRELIDALFENGYEVLISCPYGEKFTLLSDWNYIYDNPNIDRRGTSVFNDAKLFLHYLRLFAKNKPAVALTYTVKPNVYASIAAKLCSVNVINNVTGLGSVENMSDPLRRFVILMFKVAFRSSKHIFFQNASNMFDAIHAGYVSKHFSLIPGSGVNLERFTPLDYPDDETITFNYIGRILKEKGVDDYIAAAKNIRSKHPNTKFNIIGFIEPTEAQYIDKFKRLENDGIVHYLGSQKDVRPFIEKSHCLIHPSVYGEGMSNVLLENAASARPVITTDRPGCRETVLDGLSGFVYSGGSSMELIDTIERFLALTNEERRKMGLRGRKHVEEKFSRQIVVDAYLDEISKLV